MITQLLLRFGYISLWLFPKCTKHNIKWKVRFLWYIWIDILKIIRILKATEYIFVLWTYLKSLFINVYIEKRKITILRMFNNKNMKYQKKNVNPLIYFKKGTHLFKRHFRIKYIMKNNRSDKQLGYILNQHL